MNLTSTIGVITLISIVCVGAWLRYDSLVNERDSLVAQVEAQKLALAVNKSAIASLEAAAQDSEALRIAAEARAETAQAAVAAAISELNATREVFSNHDFANLLQAKPGLVERRMKLATAAVWEELAEASSAP